MKLRDKNFKKKIIARKETHDKIRIPERANELQHT